MTRRSRRAPRNGARTRAQAVAGVLAALTVLSQIAYPLLDGEPLRLLTIANVLVFVTASLVHAAATRGLAWAAGLLVIAGGIGLGAEAVGVATGVPFGSYSYSDTLGPQLLDVPVIVPLAWTMMAYPCLLLGRRLSRAAGRRRRGRASSLVAVATGALALASWDLFLDPQMVADGRWTWKHPTPALPGVPGIPITNFLGWVLVAVVVVGALQLLLPDTRRAAEGVPGALLAWTWAGSTLGNAVFFDRPFVAVWGGLAMGVVVVPYLFSWWDGRP